MQLGTIDRTPPPFFRQGPSALTKLTFCSALALLLMIADTRFKLTQPLRAVVATVLHPVQRTLLVPVQAWEGTSNCSTRDERSACRASSRRAADSLACARCRPRK